MGSRLLLVTALAYTVIVLATAEEEYSEVANTVLSKLKPEVKPCDDFYQFACGKYIDDAQIPADKSELTVFQEITDKVKEQLKEAIQKERESSLKHFKLPKQFYKACMNEELIETLGGEPVKEVSASLGGWPVIAGDSWNEDKSWDWQKTVSKSKRISLEYFASFSVYSNMDDTSKRIIYISQPQFGLSREYLIKGLDDKIVSAYYDYMVDTAVLFGAEKETAQKDLKKSLEFEMRLANISMSTEEQIANLGTLNNILTVKQIKEAYPYIQWLDYINALLFGTHEIDENEEINFTHSPYFDKLGSVLEGTDDRDIANYLMWRVHFASMTYLSADFRKLAQQFDSVLTGKENQQPRWEKCIDMVKEKLPVAVGALYASEYFQKDSKAAVVELIDNLRDVFKEMLSEAEWMDDITKEKAKEKLDAMAAHVGYPDELLDDNKLEEYYKELELDSDKYYESSLNLDIFGYKKFYSALRLPVDKNDWTNQAKAADVDAINFLAENRLQFPAGILQGHMFDKQRPNYMNYGAIGSVIGIEITHGFDNSGHMFDSEGNMNDWWEPATQTAFSEKAKCLIEQFDNIVDKQTGLNLNGEKIVNTNIADNGGFREAYLAYNKWLAKNGDEPQLPGLNYTSNQMFWISAAQTWCGKFKTEALKNTIEVDVHTPYEHRVSGSFKNFKNFASDFECPEDSPMNPAKKCEFW